MNEKNYCEIAFKEKSMYSKIIAQKKFIISVLFITALFSPHTSFCSSNFTDFKKTGLLEKVGTEVVAGVKRAVVGGKKGAFAGFKLVGMLGARLGVATVVVTGKDEKEVVNVEGKGAAGMVVVGVALWAAVTGAGIGGVLGATGLWCVSEKMENVVQGCLCGAAIVSAGWMLKVLTE